MVRTHRSYTLFLTIITMKQMNKINFVSIELDLRSSNSRDVAAAQNISCLRISAVSLAAPTYHSNMSADAARFDDSSASDTLA